MTNPIFGVTGWKNSGKTTLVTRLVAEFGRRGLRVSTVKHAHHSFDIDVPGTDSFRHREAGAGEVLIVSKSRWALMHEFRGEPEPPLAEVLSRLSPCDLVLIEGYKREPHPKIEVRRKLGAPGKPLAADDPTILAIAADFPTPADGRPMFHLDEISVIADFVAENAGLKRAAP